MDIVTKNLCIVFFKDFKGNKDFSQMCKLTLSKNII